MVEETTLLTEGVRAFNLKSSRKERKVDCSQSQNPQVTEQMHFTSFFFLSERTNGTYRLRLIRNPTSYAKNLMGLPFLATLRHMVFDWFE